MTTTGQLHTDKICGTPSTDAENAKTGIDKEEEQEENPIQHARWFAASGLHWSFCRSSFYVCLFCLVPTHRKGQLSRGL
jgi:hypothetical protein